MNSYFKKGNEIIQYFGGKLYFEMDFILQSFSISEDIN